jgi:hypothetical protein
MLTTANAAETNSLTCLPKDERARDDKYLVIHPMSNQRCLTSAIARRCALTAGPSNSSLSKCLSYKKYKYCILINKPGTYTEPYLINTTKPHLVPIEESEGLGALPTKPENQYTPLDSIYSHAFHLLWSPIQNRGSCLTLNKYLNVLSSFLFTWK